MSKQADKSEQARTGTRWTLMLTLLSITLMLVYIINTQQDRQRLERELQERNDAKLVLANQLTQSTAELTTLTDQLAQSAADVAALTTQLERQNSTRPGRFPVAGFYQTGQTSWYGGKFHGRQTASGEVFDKHAFTAAHRLLPLGSYARVTHLGNGRSVVLRINDRGPYSGKRVLDVSEEAAQSLGFKDKGLANVEIVGVPEQAWARFINSADKY